MNLLFIFQLILSLVLIISPAPSIATDEATPAWSYDNDYNGQEDWGALKGYEICRNGFAQSPVNIASTKISELPALNFKYKRGNSLLNITENSFIAEIYGGGTLIDGHKSYTLKTIEFHSPSSHHIRENVYPLEIHLVHKDNNGNILIVAVFAKVEGENSAITTLLEQANSKKIEKFKFDSKALVPSAQGYYSYTGSLPYPPCREGVEWKIMKEPINISQKQFSEIVKYIGRNSRLPQPLYMREVFETKQ